MGLHVSLQRSQCLFEYSFPHLSFPPLFFLYFSSHKKRHLVQTITSVPGAIGHQQRVKAAAITNSDSLIPFIPSPHTLSSFPFILIVPPLIPPFRVPSLHSFSHFLFSASPLPPPTSFSRFSRSPRYAARSPAPFTFAHYSRKSNFVTRASSILAWIPSSIPGKLHVGRHRRLERRFPLSSAVSFYTPPRPVGPSPHTGCPLTLSNQLLPCRMTHTHTHMRNTERNSRYVSENELLILRLT